MTLNSVAIYICKKTYIPLDLKHMLYHHPYSKVMDAIIQYRALSPTLEWVMI